MCQMRSRGAIVRRKEVFIGGGRENVYNEERDAMGIGRRCAQRKCCAWILIYVEFFVCLSLLVCSKDALSILLFFFSYRGQSYARAHHQTILCLARHHTTTTSYLRARWEWSSAKPNTRFPTTHTATTTSPRTGATLPCLQCRGPCAAAAWAPL